MTKEEYEQWLHNPLTKMFHQYLIDYRQVLMERWANGQIPEDGTNGNAYMIGQAQCLHDLVGLEPEEISAFYKEFR